MFLAVKKLENLSHPLIESAHFKRGREGNTLILKANFGASNQNKERSLETLLIDLNELVSRTEQDTDHVDIIDIRMDDIHKTELRAA